MARTHQRIERWDLPADRDQWEAIRAADDYLRRRLGVGKRCHAGVFDARGQIFENDLHLAYEEWQQESSPLKSVVVSYGDSTEDLYAQLHAKDLDRPAENDWWTPKLEVTVNGTDAAEVRGIAQEAIEKAEQGIVMPRIEVTDLQSGTPQPRGVQPMANPFEQLGGGSPTLASRIFNHPWAVGIGTGLVVALVVALVARLFA